MEDIAREAGVSRSLVSLAYRGAAGVSAATRHHILDVGRRLNYTPNHVAARLAGRGGNTFGVFLQDLHNDLFADVYDGLRDIAETSGKHLVLAVGTIDGGRDASSLETLEQSRVDVIIAAGLQLGDAEVRVISERVPLVSVARLVPQVDSVWSDDLFGARLVVDHLTLLGHRRIVFLANPPTDGYLDRRRGYSEAMRDAGLPERVVTTTYARARAAFDAGVLLDSTDPPTAVFAHNDQTALGVLDALVLRGLRPGLDVSVVGYDNTSGSRAPGIALTTVDVHSEMLGRNAAILATRRLEDPEAPPIRHSSMPSLVIRGSTGPVSPAH